MTDFETDLAQSLDALRAQGLYRELRTVDSPQSPRVRLAGQDLLNFSSNDYLGLANHPALKAAAIHAVERFGAGAGASRLVSGSLAPHHELEEALAGFKGAQAALAFSTGYAAALGAICALVGKDDVIVLDKLVHASLVDAARLSGAKLRVFAHNDLNDLEDILKWTARRSEAAPAEGRMAGSPSPQSSPSVRRRLPRTLVVTESLFSMDGDQAPLRDLVELKDTYHACLMVDEAHACGLYGPKQRGLAEAFGVEDRIEVKMGTLGKAFGASGGYICGSRVLIDFLLNRARTFIFSTAPVPAAAAAATAGVRLVQSPAGAERLALLHQRLDQWYSLAGPALPPPPGRPAPPGSPDQPRPRGAIIPLLIGDERKAVETAAALRAQGVLIPAIRFPTVARGSARLRLTMTAAHTAADVSQLVAALASMKLGISPSD